MSFLMDLMRRPEPEPPEWQPGDPLFEDRGPGSVASIPMSEDEREAVIAEHPVPPPWYRPVPETGSQQNRECKPCGTRWKHPREEDSPCWMCGAISPGIPNGRPS